MDLLEAIECRHSVRHFEDRKIEEEKIKILNDLIDECNKEGHLNIQLILEEPKAFEHSLFHYGLFTNVKNYIALVGKKDSELEEKCGYYGEKLVLKAQTLGLNTCWVGLTYHKNKSAMVINQGEKLCIIIALGYGITQGKERKSKKIYDVVDEIHNKPEWFINGVTAALKAPTAVNQQKFRFLLKGKTVTVETKKGPYSQIDKGIVKYHFEIGAGSEAKYIFRPNYIF